MKVGVGIHTLHTADWERIEVKTGRVRPRFPITSRWNKRLNWGTWSSPWGLTVCGHQSISVLHMEWSPTFYNG
jgi:hypothetical protein